MRNTLLIIDDSELDRAIFNEIFKRDYRVLRAATASEGIDLIRKNFNHRLVFIRKFFDKIKPYKEKML